MLGGWCVVGVDGGLGGGEPSIGDHGGASANGEDSEAGCSREYESDGVAAAGIYRLEANSRGGNTEKGWQLEITFDIHSHETTPDPLAYDVQASSRHPTCFAKGWILLKSQALLLYLRMITSLHLQLKFFFNLLRSSGVRTQEEVARDSHATQSG